MDLEEEGMGKWPLSAVGFPPNVDINCFNLFCCSLVFPPNDVAVVTLNPVIWFALSLTSVFL